MKLCGNPDLVKDQIQELFISLWNRSAPLDQIKSKKSYLLISLRRKILKKLDQKAAAQNVQGEWEGVTSFTFNAEELIIREEKEQTQKSALRAALNQLPDQQREVVYLRFYRGLSYQEIEEVLSINYQSAVNHVYRATTRLQSILNNHQSDIPLLGFIIFGLALIA